MSLQGGDVFTSELTPGTNAHTEHRNGLSVDIRYMRSDGQEGSALASIAGQVDLPKTQQLISLFLQSGFTRRIIIDSRVGVQAGEYEGGVQVVHDNAVHYNHIHVDVWDPDGTQN